MYELSEVSAKTHTFHNFILIKKIQLKYDLDNKIYYTKNKVQFIIDQWKISCKDKKNKPLNPSHPFKLGKNLLGYFFFIVIKWLHNSALNRISESS